MSPPINKPIVKLTEKPIPCTQNVVQPKVTLKVPIPESSSSHDKIFQYQITQFLKQDLEMIQVLEWSKEKPYRI